MSDVTGLPLRTAPQRFDVFLSHNSRDRAVVERIAERLKLGGLEPWLDKWSLTPGGDWQQELGAGLDASGTCAVFVGPHDLGAWELQEVAVAVDRAATQQGFRVFPVLLPGVEEPFDPNRLPHFLRARTWVDFRGGRDDGRALQHLINAIKGVPFGPDLAVVPDDEIAPYRGLRVFREDDAQFFFGRDREVQRLLEKLKGSPFLAVLGPSGSGKSSLVRAGLLPELRRGGLAEVEHWQVCVLRPGAAPLTALAAQLAALGPGEAMQATLRGLAHDPQTLHLSVELALADRSAGARVLLMVDQLEEIFTVCDDEAQRRQFFSTLLYAASAPGGRTVVIVTMRADFYARCAAYPELAQLMTAQQTLVGPMDRDGLRQAIEEPARRVGLQLEEGLSDTILADVAAEPGALPLLEHALLELWERRRGAMLTLEAYRETGGVDGALAQRAEAIFGRLTPEQQAIARRTLLRLTQPGEGTEDTRRRATRHELAPAAETGESFDSVLGRLVDARMLTTGRDETGMEVVDVSHEALIRGWPRLRRWIDADRAGLLILRRLTDAAREWNALDRDAGALYRGARLATASEWASDHAGDLSQVEADFLAASQAAERRERGAARRRTQRLRALAAGLGALALVAGGSAIFALRAAERADSERRTALSRSLAIQALAPAQDHDLAALLSLEAYRVKPTVEARDAILQLLPKLDREKGTLRNGHPGFVSAVAYSPDGKTLASGSSDGSMRLWDTATHRARGESLDGHGWVTGLAFSPDGSILASASQAKAVRLWDTATHRPLGPPLETEDDTIYSVTFSPDGKTLATDGAEKVVRLWDAATRRQLGRPLEGHRHWVVSVAFSPDGETLASAGADETVRLWDPARRRPLGKPLDGHNNMVRAIAFSADGKTLASAGDDGTVRLWDPRRRRQLGRPLRVHHDGADGVAFSPDGRTLATSAADNGDEEDNAGTKAGTARLWDIRSRRPVSRPLEGPTQGFNAVAFSPDGKTLASVGEDGNGGTVRLWEAQGYRPLGLPLLGNSESVGDVAFSPDGGTFVSAGQDESGAIVRLWDARSQRPRGPPLLQRARPVGSVAFSPDGNTLAIAVGPGGGVRLWDTRRRQPLGGPTMRHGGGIFGLAFGIDGKTLASAGEYRDGGAVRLWDVESRRSLGAPLERPNEVSGVAFSPDGRMLASAEGDGSVRLIDARNHRPLGRPLQGGADAVHAIAFSPDGKTLASADEQGDHKTVRLWDVRSHRPLGRPLTGHTDRISSVAFSADGKTLASSDERGSVRLWHVKSHRPLGQPLEGHAHVSRVAFSTDGSTLASAGFGVGLRFWDPILWSDSWLAFRDRVCAAVGYSFTEAEWRAFVPGEPYHETCGPG